MHTQAYRKYPLPGFTDRDGKQSYVYSGCDPAVVQLHFQWMRDYDIDGALVQLWPIKFPGQPLSRHVSVGHEHCSVCSGCRGKDRTRLGSPI